MVGPSACSGAGLKFAGAGADRLNVTDSSEGRKAALPGVMELT